MNDETSRIRKVLTSDLGLIMQVAIPIVTVVFFSAGISKDIEYIKQEIVTINTNHLTHMQTAIEEIKDNESSMRALLEKTAALLNQHLEDEKSR